ncbi:MAG: hypothetical protein IJK52_00710 [Oscillospiraceae bacterium]|nr:hypothetical protein [Oscillospiraceae bacterium]
MMFLLVAIVLLVLYLKQKKKLKEAQGKLEELHYDEYAQVQAELERMNQEITDGNVTASALLAKIQELTEQEAKLSKQAPTAANKLARSRELYKSMEYAMTAFVDADPALEHCRLPSADSTDIDNFAPSVILHLHSIEYIVEGGA